MTVGVCSVLQCVAVVYCSVLQWCVAARDSHSLPLMTVGVLQCVVVCCSGVLKCIAVV